MHIQNKEKLTVVNGQNKIVAYQKQRLKHKWIKLIVSVYVYVRNTHKAYHKNTTNETEYWKYINTILIKSIVNKNWS